MWRGSINSTKQGVTYATYILQPVALERMPPNLHTSLSVCTPSRDFAKKPALMTVADALAVDANSLNGVGDVDLKLNGLDTPIDTDNGALSSGPDSPAIPSPPTNAESPAVKIDLDYAQRGSDARHEPIPLSLEKQDDVSTHPQLGSPQDPGVIISTRVYFPF